MIPRFHIRNIHQKQLDGRNKNSLRKLRATASWRTPPTEQLPTGTSLYDRCFKSWRGLEFRMGKPPILVAPGCTMTIGTVGGYTVTRIVDRIKFSWDFDSKAADMRTFSSLLEDHFTHDYWNTTLPLWDLRDVEFEMMPMGSSLRTEGWRKLDPEDLSFPAASTNWKGKGVSSGHGEPGKVWVRGLDPYERPHSDAYILRISITLEVEKDKAMIARSRIVATQKYKQPNTNVGFELYSMLHPSFHPGNRSMVFTYDDKLNRSLKRLSTTVYFEPKHSPT